MKRRTFLALAGGLAAGAVLPRSFAVAATSDRASKWAPNPNQFLALEWRYLAGRITDGSGDFGFIVSLMNLRTSGTQKLVVERQDFGGAFVSKTYTGALAYDKTTATYSFADAQSQASATWQWDEAQQVYRLAVASPKLNLSGVVLRPQGALIPEGGTGVISGGQALGLTIVSNYHADWTAIEIGGINKGVARLDIQDVLPATARSIWPQPDPAATLDYDHHWFAIAGRLGAEPVWVSAWRIEAQGGPLWDVTIARGSGATWQAASLTEQAGAATPLLVQPLVWQTLPVSAGADLAALRAGTSWRLTAGATTPGDLLDLEVAVPAGQFSTSARLGAAGGVPWVEEAVGTTAAGTVLGQPLSDIRLVVAETTAEYYAQALALVE